MDDGHINPDNPLLQQIDTLFRQLAQGGAIPTENDIKFADLIADCFRLWAGIEIAEVEPEMEPEQPEQPEMEAETWTDYVRIAAEDASRRRN